MLRTILCLCGLLSAPAWADLTVAGTHSPGLYGGVDRFKLYLRQGQMRIDQVTPILVNGQHVDTVDASILIRFEGTPAGLLLLDHEARTVQVAAQMLASDATTATATSGKVVSQGDEKVVAGFNSWRYDYAFKGPIDPSVLAGMQMNPAMSEMMQLELLVTGTSWLVPDMPGQDELTGFLASMAAKRITIGQLAGPLGSLMSPGLSAGLTGFLADLSREGFPMHTISNANVKSRMEGQTAMLVEGTLLGLGIPTQFASETSVNSVSTAEVSASLFYQGGLPNGYQLVGQ